MEDEHNIDINPSGITSKKGGGMTQSKSEKKRAVSKNNRKRKNKINEAETTETKESTEKVDLKASRLKRSIINNQDQKLENKNSNYNELNEHPSAEFESHYEGDVINYGEITNANSDVDVIKNKTTVSTSNQKAITISDTEIDKNIEQTAYHIEANQKTERGSMRDSNKKNAKVSPIVLKEKTIVGSTSLGGNKTVTFSTKSIDLKTDKKSETLGNSSIAEQLKGQEDFVSPTDFSQDIAVTEKDILKETAIKITSSEDSTVSNKVNSFEKSNIKNNAITEVIDNHNYENQSQLKENNDNNTKFLLKNNMKKLNDINKDSGESKKAKILTYNNITPKDGINKESMTENSEHDHTSGLNGSLGRPFNKAIVEVLDRVDTPEVNNRNVNDQNILQTDSFSVLQSEIVEPPEKYCCCPNCRKKSKNTKSRIPRLNNNCSLAPANDLNTMSVTRAVQISSRKYHIERLIFYQLSELKRLQIRVGKSDERVLVKRLIEEYGRTGTFIGLQRYEGPYSFKRFEKYLYDQLSTLQKQLPFKEGQSVIPHVQSIDEIEKITGALRRINAGKTVVEDPDDCLSCVRSTHRCNHTTHAYTGVPCAAYIPKLKLNHHRMPKLVADRQRFLPDIRQDGPRATRCLRNVDPSKPITLHFENGSCSQVIDLPTDKLDKNKRYFVTLTIKDTDLQEKNRTVTPILSDNNHTLLAHTHAKSF
ncbi:uncharacterized protein DDB_G0287625-like isoform X1 [Daktulosphaira vitifoliae]|uniref:uncharacterized protein DDB_G0287625-like isoform X1 n=1 Tax=Daktulosphaira vitifoliae TaxID=58002 RepID=UPI0021AA1F4F|nr:uncharacterized protein DDB_G0287625-like isoform X1 [Daktulosphaira vitifoliae]